MLHRRDRQSKDLVGSKSELVVVVVVAALVVKVPVVVVEVAVAAANSLLTLSGTAVAAFPCEVHKYISQG